MLLGIAVQSVLKGISVYVFHADGFFNTYEVPVSAAHFQRPIPAHGLIEMVAITDDVLESVAATPVTRASLSVSLQWIGLLKIVP